MLTMPGGDSMPAERASRSSRSRKRSCSSGLRPSPSRIVLMATGRPILGSMAWYTTPMAAVFTVFFAVYGVEVDARQADDSLQQAYDARAELQQLDRLLSDAGE